MLLEFKSLSGLSFGKLMDVYAQSNRETGYGLGPGLPQDQQIWLAEQDFYSYLRECFFRTGGARYMIWEETGRYVSALRLEPYRDGLLLAGLETHPDFRQRGYAVQLITAVQDALMAAGETKLYSHVEKRNVASLRTHRKCGFRIIQDYAVFIDGSVDRHSCTLRFEAEI